jgi:hypothetical protein
MAKKGRAILLVFTDLVDEKYDDEFNAWYDTQHLPEVLSWPGFLDAARYVAVAGGPKYLAAIEMESVAARSEAFKSRPRAAWDLRMSPRVIGKNTAQILGEQIFPAHVEHAERGMAPVLQIGRMSVPASEDAAWNAWYNGEYIPGYLTVPGVTYARRFRVIEGDVAYTTVYEFEHESVPKSPEWDHQRLHSSPKNLGMRDAMTMAPGSPGVYRLLKAVQS